jgi:ATP-binding cassette, subfamily B, bacterial
MQMNVHAFNTRLRAVLSQFMYLPRTLRLVWAATRGYTIAWAVLLIVQGVLPAVMVYLSKLVVDTLTGAIGSGLDWNNLRPVVNPAAAMVGLMVLSEVLRSVTELVRSAQSEYIEDYIVSQIHQQSVAVDLSFYESPDYYDRLDQARSEASQRSQALLEHVGTLVQHGVTLGAMSAVLLPYGWWLPPVLLVSMLPALYVVLRYDRRYHQWWKQTTAERRRAFYYNLMLTESAAAAEVRLFGLGRFFQSAYQAVRRRLRTERLHLLRSQHLARLGAAGWAFLICGAAVGWMVWSVSQGQRSLGDLVLFYQAWSRGQTLVRSLLGSVGKIYSTTLFLESFFTFLELQSTVVEPAHPVPAPETLKRGIEFRDVTFRYPGSDRPALDQFNLAIPAGTIAAIVGLNGAGKTTLVKLLCRFYDPEAGSVEVDGINVRDLSMAQLHRLITVLFQAPMRYQATVRQNIAFGDVERAITPEELQTAAAQAGVHSLISRLPQTYDAQLGKWLGEGAELSGGEWQRMAMARAYVRQSPIIVLDEPTSAMDSWAEADWFERLRALAKGRTGLLITHRFTIAMRADIIHVMDGGRIVESGTHDELVALGGHYARSWQAQMQAGTCAPACDSTPEVLTMRAQTVDSASLLA